MPERTVVIRHTGFAGHLCIAAGCRFHLTTEVGDCVVSTVGAYLQKDEKGDENWGEVGYNRKFETMVFRLGEACRCRSDCGTRKIADWAEIDFAGYQTPAAAQKGHERMVEKYAAVAASSEGREHD